MRFVSTLLVAATLALPASLAAQKLTPGTWTGTVAPPNNSALDATFDVRTAGDTTKLTISVGGRGFEATDLKVEKDRLLFVFSTGANSIRCTLMLGSDKSYTGDCIDSNGGKGVIAMKPPKS